MTARQHHRRSDQITRIDQVECQNGCRGIEYDDDSSRPEQR